MFFDMFCSQIVRRYALLDAHKNTRKNWTESRLQLFCQATLVCFRCVHRCGRVAGGFCCGVAWITDNKCMLRNPKTLNKNRHKKKTINCNRLQSILWPTQNKMGRSLSLSPTPSIPSLGSAVRITWSFLGRRWMRPQPSLAEWMDIISFEFIWYIIYKYIDERTISKRLVNACIHYVRVSGLLLGLCRGLPEDGPDRIGGKISNC